MDMSLLESRGRMLWFGYKVFPQKANILEGWSLVGGVILRGFGNFRRQGLTGGSRSLVACPWELYLMPDTFPSPSSHEEVNSFALP
jgi:hypothetical protein